MEGSKQFPQGTDERVSSVRVLIRHNLNHVMKGIKAEKATDMKHITHHAQNATLGSFRNGQPVACPDHHMVSECAQQHQHLLSVKALLIALGQPQSLLVAFQGRFDAAAPAFGVLAAKFCRLPANNYRNDKRAVLCCTIKCFAL
jgi:hypothetical protein